MPFAAFGLLYSVALVVTQPANDGPIIGRLWLPAAVVLVFVACEALDTALDGSILKTAARSLRLRVVAVGAATAIFAMLAYMSLLTASDTRSVWAAGYVDSEAVHGLAESPVIAHLRDNPTDGELFSNRAAGVYLLTDILPVRRIGPNSGELTDTQCLELLRNPSRSESNDRRATAIRIAWFDEPRRNDRRAYCDIPQIAARSALLEPVSEYADGAIYRFDPAG